MKIYLFLVLVLLFSVSSVFALSSSVSDGDVMCSYMKNELDMKVGGIVPDWVPYSNEVFNVYTGNHEVFASVVISDSVVTHVDCDKQVDATYDVYVKDLSVMEDMYFSSNKVDTYNELRSNGDLVIDGLSFGKDIKQGFVNMGAVVSGWFS